MSTDVRLVEVTGDDPEVVRDWAAVTELSLPMFAVSLAAMFLTRMPVVIISLPEVTVRAAPTKMACARPTATVWVPVTVS